MTDHADASATLRGFRNQFLYVLYRVLTDNEAEKRVYRPEGSEDLAVFDSSQTLIESSQVKDYSSDLTLSALSPKSKNGFISRYYARLTSQPQATTRLVSFGPLGPELTRAIRGSIEDDDHKSRESVVKKLCEGNSAISQIDAVNMLNGLRDNVEHPKPQMLLDEVIKVLDGTFAGGHSESTLELLMYWVFESSEQQRDITKSGLLAQIEAIGEYLAALRDASIEWGVSVSPVSQEVLTSDEMDKLVREYQLGIQAGWRHILAGADCPRPERLAEIHGKLRENSAVIVRGASGQGKSTLGWRYLYEYCAEGSRFHVKLVEGREHAMRIVNAIEAHVRKLRLSVVVYLDVAPHDSGWEELVRGLTDANLKVLLTIREEDFRRSRIDVSAFDYAEVVLEGVNIQEAKSIYDSLRLLSRTDALGFDDLWGQFTVNDDGPLMEFTHLITQGETLQSKIASQVARLRRDINSGHGHVNIAHLHLLAIAVIANSAEARVDYLALCAEVGLEPISKPLEVLEHEYLLPVRIDGGQTLVAGLHSLRSLAVEKALVPVEQWSDYATRAIGVVDDPDIEKFLLHAFSRRGYASDAIVNAIRNLGLRTWTHAGGICRALIWLGLSRYEEANSEAIRTAIQQHGLAWIFCCDIYVGFEGDSFQERQREAFGAELPAVSLTSKTDIFGPLTHWATTATPPTYPASSSDWRGAGDIAYWLGRRKVTGALRDSLASMSPEGFDNEVALESIAAFISGVCEFDDREIHDWHNRISSELKKRFVAYSDSIAVVENGQQIAVYFGIALRKEESTSGEIVTSDEEEENIADWHSQAMTRIFLLRDLFPTKSIYASQGIGLELFASLLEHDPTKKQIPVENLPDSRAVYLNATFLGLVNYRHNRPGDWREYSDKIVEYRKLVRTIFRNLHRTWDSLLSNPSVKQSILNRFPREELKLFVANLPMLPRKAVDEWGFASEGRSKESTEENSEAILRRFTQWRQSSSQYSRGIGNVFSRIFAQTNMLVRFKSGRPIEDTENVAHLIVANLADAWKALKVMQREFRRHFGNFYSGDALEELEQHEQINCRHLWCSSIAIRHGMSTSGAAIESQATSARRQLLDRLQSEVAAAMEGIGSIEVMLDPWVVDDVDYLRIICNHFVVNTIEPSKKGVIEAIWRAFHFREWDAFEWEPIAVEWQKVAIVHQVRGRCLSPSLITLHTDVLFLSSGDFEVKDYHLAMLPMDKSSFLGGGFSLWDTPLLRTAIEFNESMLLLFATMARLSPLVEVLEDVQDDATIELAMRKFVNELDTTQLRVRQHKADLEQLLRLDEGGDATRMVDTLHDHCEIRLGDFDLSSSDVGLDRLNQWWKGVSATNDAYAAFTSDLFEYAIRERATNGEAT